MQMIEEKRKRGSNKRFMDVVRKDMQAVGVKEGDAEDRKKWRWWISCDDP